MSGELAVVQSHPHQLAVARREVTAEDLMPVLDMARAIQRHNFMVDVTKQLMIPDVDFGTIPGSNKPTLLKPGAERLCTLYGLSPEFSTIEATEDWSGDKHGGEPFFYYRYKARLTKNGITLGEGEGSCNSWESKYRYRWVREDQLLSCFVKDNLPRRGGVRNIFEPDFAIQKAETGGKYGKPAEYWQRFKDGMENGTAKRVKDKQMGSKKFDGWEITVDELQYRIPNPEVADIVNTVQKMAQKRALVAGVLVATNASEFYTQDMEDMHTIEAEVVPVIPAQRNSPEQQAELAQRRIAEEKAKAAAAAPARDAEVVSDDPMVQFEQMFRMADKFMRLEFFQQFKKRFMAVLNKDKGEIRYYDHLGAAGVQKSDGFKTLGDALKCAKAMLLDLLKLEAGAAAFATEQEGQRNPEITDDDLPPVLQGTAGKERPRPATLSHINRFRETLGEQAWFAILGSQGYESMEAIPNEEAAVALKRLMQEEEAAANA